MMYDLVYYINKKRVATVIYNRPKPLCLGMKKQFKLQPLYQMGRFELEPVK